MRALWSATVLSALSAAGQLPEPVFPEGMGVNIHFVTGHEKDLDLIQAAGFKFVRMDFAWGGIERRKGEYDWSGYDQLVANLEKRGLRGLFILDYSNDLYEERVTTTDPIHGGGRKSTASPQRPESVAAFAKWAGAAAAHFKGRRIIWEIWNEPNIFFWSPKPDVRQYTTLALATCKAVRDADPDASIVAPATSGFPWEFLEEFFKAGALEHLDGVSVHPYRDYKRSPETAAADYQRLRALIDRYTPPVKKGKLPILSGEWGYATHDKGVTLETQAAFAARQQIVNLLNNVPLSIWYDWKNDGPDPSEREHHFGTVTTDLQPKPSYLAIQTLARELAGCRIERRLESGGPDDYIVVCRNAAGRRTIAAWTTGTGARVELMLSGVPERGLEIVNWKGETSKAETDEAKLTLQLGPLPQYVELGEAGVK